MIALMEMKYGKQTFQWTTLQKILIMEVHDVMVGKISC
jgi:hypothetical protein